jgi:hypothetical protein
MAHPRFKQAIHNVESRNIPSDRPGRDHTRSLWSIVQIRREDWSDIAVARDSNPAPGEET